MKQILTFFLLLLTIGLYAQPANDDCSGIIDLGVAPNCDSTLYNNIGAMESDIGADNFPGCFVGVPARDVWFQFTATTDFLDYRIEVTGCEDPDQMIQAMSNPQVAVYRGDCVFDGLQLLDCVSATLGESSVFIDLIGLTPNITYFLRINDWTSTGTPNDGAFKLCVREKPPINTVDEGSSSECSGTLTDSGGEFGDYGANENFTFTICPSEPHECILFDMQYYNVEYSADQIYFFDGPDTSSPQVGSISGNGTVPTPNEGGVCYSVTASSGCLTVQFISDASMSFEGFLGSWQCTSDACPEAPEMIVDTDADQSQIVESVISGQTLISLVDVNCANGTVGTFNVTDDTDLAMDKGLVLSSGDVTQIPQPAVNFAGNVFCGLNCTDDDLNTLSTLYGNGEQAQDACIVEMDILAASEELTFEYVFGSEEYPNFISPGTAFNDIFAFLVSGPGIMGDPNIGNKLNVATLPDGTFIQIEDVNQSDNWQYYRDNSNSQSIVYGGLTSDSLGIKKSLTARVPTQPCETYKLKFAIADRGDASFDSGVFISKINSGTPELSVDYQSGIEYLVEDCTAEPDQIVISFGNQLETSQTYNIVIGGSAEQGVDYELNIPSTILFETGTEIFTFPITVLTDNLVEGIDTIEISLTRDFGCGELVISTIILEIHDNLDIDIANVLQDTAILCATADCIPLEVIGAQDYSWSPDTLFDDPSSLMPVVCTDSSQWVYVEGTLGICNDIDSVYINVIDVEVDILPDVDNIEICQGETLEVTAVNNVNNQNLNWTSFFTNFPDPSNPTQVISDDSNFGFTTATVTAEIGGCTATDFINVNWVAFDLPQLIEDDTICQNSSVQLAEEIESFSTTYQWTPDLYLSPSADVSGPTATPEETTTYTLISSAGTGANACSDTSSVTITVLPADIDIQPQDTVFICLGETAILTGVTTNNIIDISWSPQSFLTQITDKEVEVNPTSSQYYYATIETPDCIVIDSVWVQVDSLPDLSIMTDPDKDSFCEGEEVLLFSTTYEPANFPAIDHLWDPNLPGVQTPDSFLNLVFIALEDFTYIRTTTVNACTSVDSIVIEVTPVTSMTVIPSDTTVCQGETIQFTIDGPAELTEFMWSPPNGLSCSDCREPTLVATQSVTYQVEAEFEGCPVGASASVNVPSQFFQYSGPNPICPGESVILNTFSVPGATYTWTSSDGSLNTNEPNPSASPAQTTTYNLVALLDDCSFETSLTINVEEDFILEVEDPGLLCPGDLFSLVATTTPSANTVEWFNQNGTLITNANNLTAVSSQTYTVEATSNCFFQTASVNVNVADAAAVGLPVVVDENGDTLFVQGNAMFQDSIFEGQQVEMLTDVIVPIPGATYTWTLNGDTIAVTSDPSSGIFFLPEVDQNTEYFFRVYVETPNGCIATTFVLITVLNNPVEVPNVFTPNNDGTNDLFRLVSLIPVEILDFQVWNRWGKLVYEGEDGVDGWDGTIDGDAAASDVYIYSITYQIPGSNNPLKPLKGDVTLLR